MVVGFIVLVHYWFRFLQHNVNHGTFKRLARCFPI